MGLSENLHVLLGEGGSPPVTGQACLPRALREAHPSGKLCACPQRFELLGLLCLSKYRALLLFFNSVRNLVHLSLCAVHEHWPPSCFLHCFTPHPPEYLFFLLLFFNSEKIQGNIYKMKRNNTLPPHLRNGYCFL